MSKTPPNSIVSPTLKTPDNSKLQVKTSSLVPPKINIQDDLFHIEKQVEFDGIEMGLMKTEDHVFIRKLP